MSLSHLSAQNPHSKSKNLTKALQGSCLSLHVHPLALSLLTLTLPLILLLPLRPPCWFIIVLDLLSVSGPLHTLLPLSCSSTLLQSPVVTFSGGHPDPPCQHNSPIWHLSSCFIFFPSIFHPLTYFKCICLCLYGPSFLDCKLYEGRHCPQGKPLKGLKLGSKTAPVTC